MLAALTGKATKNGPQQYVKDLFDKYSTRFDRHVVEKLAYRTPTLLCDKLLEVLGHRPHFANVMDLGCGTGLSGAAFAHISGSISGIDVSPKIVAVARRKEIYETLHVGDIIDILGIKPIKNSICFVAADVFVYIGDLKAVFASVEKHSSDGAYFVFFHREQ